MTYLAVMALAVTICILASVATVTTAVDSENTKRVFTISTMDGEEIEYDYRKLDASECMYNSRLGKSTCMDDYSFQEVANTWKRNSSVVKYVSVNCRIQDNVAGVRSSCLCKTSGSYAKFYPCQVDKLQAELFSDLNQLELIDLSNNKITSIDEDAFKGLQNVKYVSLSNNTNLRHLPHGVVCDVPNLEYLGLSGVDSEVFPSHVFVCKTNLTKLLVIDMSGSYVKDVRNDSMSRLPSLRFLDLSNNKLIQIYKSSFSGGTSLEHLDLSNNNLAYLFPHFCDYLPKLTFLHLRGNNLTNFSFDEMAGCSALISLDLSQNNMATLVGNTSAFRSLEMFDISSNNLVDFTVKLNTQTSLRSLNMSHNRFFKLASDAFNSLGSLSILDVSSNVINSTNNFKQLFRPLEGVTYLNLSDNKITHIPNNSFASMTNLTSLFLSHNTISTLNTLSFNGLDILSRLSLDFNELDSLALDIFAPLTSLKHLTLSHNRLVSVSGIAPLSLISLDVSVNELASFPSSLDCSIMQTLNVSHNNLETFIGSNENALVNFNSLDMLDLSFNKIRDISRTVFSSSKNLTYLSLEKNNLDWNLTSNIFVGTSMLSTLNIAGNVITEVGSLFHPGSSLNNLISLNISSNPLNIRKFAAVDTKVMIGIESIDLSNCSISVLDQFTFTNMSDLRYVFLSNNEIRTLKPFLATSTTKYDLTDNPLHCTCDMLWLKNPYYEFPGPNGTQIRIPVHQFKVDTCSIYREDGIFRPENLLPVKFLCRELHNCSQKCDCYKPHADSAISVVDCSNRSLTSLPSPIASTAKSIYLDGSEFTLPDSLSAFNALVDPMDATELYLNNSGIKSLHSSVFSAFVKLEVLQLANNNIRILPVGVFDNLPLREIRLNGNQLTKLETDLFRFDQNDSLSLLDLSYNGLELFTEQTASELTSLTSAKFLLGNNPWACNCSNAHFKAFITKRGQSILDWKSVICKQTGQQVVYLPKTDFVCLTEGASGPRHTAAIIVLIFVGIALLIVLAVSYYYRRELVSLLYYYTGCHIPGRSKFSGMHFDAFVCYNPAEQHSKEYLENVLMPKLRNNGFNVQTSGDLISDIEVTQKTVEDSRCSLFIINQNFSSNPFLLKVFQIAEAVTNIEKRHNIILLIHGEVDLYAMEPEMLKHLRRGDYITARSRVWWQRLLYELPYPSGHKFGGHVNNDNVSESDVIVFSTLENDTYEST